jgi:hypothetical protein
MEPNGTANGRAKAPFALAHDSWGRLVLTDGEGRQHVNVEAIRAFPLSDSRRGIALCDHAGYELLWIEELDKLPAPLRDTLEKELAQREFVPVVRRVVRVSAPVEPSEWEIETDRGRAIFVLNNEDDVHRLDDRRALITDAHGIRYLIPDTHQLDAVSRRLLERYL